MMKYCPNCFREGYGEVHKNYCAKCGYRGESVNNALCPGTVINKKYMLGKVLGKGGFGITYLAWDGAQKKKCAVKEYFPQQFAQRASDTKTLISIGEEYQNGLEKFWKEANALYHFNKERNIISVWDFVKENETAYMIMEYVEGETLGELVYQKQKQSGTGLELELANSIVTVLSSILENVHKEGMLHRDISPDNIMITRNKIIKLLDFGATKFYLGDKTTSSFMICKHGYSPPEQYTKGGFQGPWTDVYALAATYYYAVSGKIPPPAMDRVMHSLKLVPLHRLRKGISPAISSVIERAMACDYRKRFQDMNSFNLELQQAILIKEKPKKKIKKQNAESGKYSGNISLSGKTPCVHVILPQKTISTVYTLGKNEVLYIGRDKSCRISFPQNPYIGRRHCSVYYHAGIGKFILKDMSKNGTYINGEKLSHGAVSMNAGQEFFIFSGNMGEKYKFRVEVD